MNKNTKSKFSQWIIILFLGTNICSCSKENTETEIIPVYDLKTEFVKTMDLTDDIGFTFQYQHDSTDTYLCRYSTYFLRKSQTVENISVKRQGNELWINVDGSDACWILSTGMLWSISRYTTCQPANTGHISQPTTFKKTLKHRSTISTNGKGRSKFYLHNA